MTKILGFGDSLTAGTPGYEPGYGGDVRSQYGFWLMESARHEGITTLQFHNQGVPGELAIQMKPRLRRLLEKESYDIAIIWGGTNDLGWGYDPEAVHETLVNLWKVSLDAGIQTITCTIPPIGSQIPDHLEKQRMLNERILANEHQLQDFYVVEVFSALANDSGTLMLLYDSGDGLHLNVEGYRVVGTKIWHDILRHIV